MNKPEYDVNLCAGTEDFSGTLAGESREGRGETKPRSTHGCLLPWSLSGQLRGAALLSPQAH